MSQHRKSELYALYKQIAEPTKHYRDYTTDELEGLLAEAGVDVTATMAQPPVQSQPDPNEIDRKSVV